MPPRRSPPRPCWTVEGRGRHGGRLCTAGHGEHRGQRLPGHRRPVHRRLQRQCLGPEFPGLGPGPRRQSGDTGLVKNESSSTKGWHIMYFVGWNDPSWMYSVKTTLKSEDMTEWMDSSPLMQRSSRAPASTTFPDPRDTSRTPGRLLGRRPGVSPFSHVSLSVLSSLFFQGRTQEPQQQPRAS